MNRPTLRQGDVLLVPVTRMPARKRTKVVARDPRGIVLAEGEVTGHFHSIADAPDAEFVETVDTIDRFLRLRSAGTLTHQEHAAIDVMPGAYKVVIHREYDELTMEPRRVVD